MEKYDLLKWKEFGVPEAPSIRILFNPSKYPGQDSIADYLDSGRMSIVSTSLSEDKISGELIVPYAADCVRSNGDFSWIGSLGYYVRKYNLRLPAEYETYILSRT